MLMKGTYIYCAFGVLNNYTIFFNGYFELKGGEGSVSRVKLAKN